jgi:hypothetical protein
MGKYSLIPRATTAPFEPTVVALVGGTTKTVLQVATPAGTDLRPIAWSVSFDGISGTAIPVICQLIETDVAATVTALSPELWGNAQQPASLCVSGTSASGYNASVEGTIAAVRQFDAQHAHPQSGYGVWWSFGDHQFRVSPSRFLRIRCKAPAAVNVIPGIWWAEPAL